MRVKAIGELRNPYKESKDALRELYEKYVVDLHGPGTCDCDPSVGLDTCAPCKARAVLGIELVTCGLCGKPAEQAHRHQGRYIGECCWDERLKITE